jgi:site-specific recombinase
MADPVSIIGLSIQVVQILAPIVNALRNAYRDGKTVHETLRDLQSDLDAVYELTDNIHRLFSVPSFIVAVRGVQNESNVTLVESLERALEGCSREAQRLLDILMKLGLQIRDGRIKQAHLQWRLDRRMDDIDRLKRNFQDHKSSIQLAFQLLTT